MAPIPIAMCGKVTPHAIAFTKMMEPEYEIVFRFESVSEYFSSIEPLLSGRPVNPISGVGSNTDNPNPKIPLAIFVGGGFAPEEMEQMRGREEANQLPWITPSQEGRAEVRAKGDLMSKEQQQSGPGKGMMEIVVERVKDCLKSHGVVDGQEGWKGNGGELWLC